MGPCSSSTGNAALDAKNFFDEPGKPIPPFVQNQFGGVLGGPLSIPGIQDGENRTFFFLNYEGQRIRKSITKTFSVPTAAMRSGNLSELGTIHDPLTGRQPFPGNRIPAERLDPVALTLLDFVPLPNRPGTVQNLVATPSEETDMDQFNLKLDHLASPTDSLFARLSIYNVDTFQPFGTTELNEALLPGFGRFLSTRARNLALSYTHMFSPAVFNEFRFGWLRVSGGQRSENEGFDFAGASGLQGVTSDPRDMGFPQISLGGEFSAMGDPTSFVFRTNQSFEFFENLAIHRGNHQIKFGGYWFHLRFNPSNPQAARGSFSFTPRFTSSAPGLSDGSALADFLLGTPTTGQAGMGRGEEDARTNWYHGYLQDDWRVSPSLTLNLGLRYEFNQQMEDVNNELSAIDPLAPGGRFVIASDEGGNISPRADDLLPVIPIPYTTSAEAGWSPSLLTNSYKRLAPRLGLAWRIGAGDTVLRSGFGIFRNQWAYSVQQNLARNLPFFFLKEISTPSDATVPPFRTMDMLSQDFAGSVGGNNMDHDFRTEYTQTWSLGIQRQLFPSTLLEIQYMGSRTVGADNSIFKNVPLPGPGPISARRAIPELSGFQSIRWDGWSTYNALIARLEKRISSGLAFAANYTFSKSLDDASAPGGTSAESNLPQNGERLDLEKALSSFHHTHLFTGNFIYEIPLGEGIPTPRPGMALRPAGRLEGDGHRDPAERGSLYREHHQRPCQRGAWPCPEAKLGEKSQPAQRTEGSGPLVRHGGLLVARPVHLRRRQPQFGVGSALSQLRFFPDEDDSGSGADRPPVPCGVLQPVQHPQLRHP